MVLTSQYKFCRNNYYNNQGSNMRKRTN